MIGTFGGGEGDEVVDELDNDEVVEVVDLFLGGAGGGVIGSTFTLHSLEFRLGEIRAGKLSVLVHCDRLRTMVTQEWCNDSILKLMLPSEMACSSFTPITSFALKKKNLFAPEADLPFPSSKT